MKLFTALGALCLSITFCDRISAVEIEEAHGFRLGMSEEALPRSGSAWNFQKVEWSETGPKGTVRDSMYVDWDRDVNLTFFKGKLFKIGTPRKSQFSLIIMGHPKAHLTQSAQELLKEFSTKLGPPTSESHGMESYSCRWNKDSHVLELSIQTLMSPAAAGTEKILNIARFDASIQKSVNALTGKD